jgi:hypothetical protein
MFSCCLSSIPSRLAIPAPTSIISTATTTGAATSSRIAGWTTVALRNFLTAGARLVLENHPPRKLDAVVGVDVDDPNPELVALGHDISDVGDAFQREL